MSWTFHYLLRRDGLMWFAVCVVILICTTDIPRAQGDTGNLETFVRLHALPWTLGSPYTQGSDRNVPTWVYPGEPLEVDLSLSNNSAAPIKFRRQGKEWFQATAFSLEPLESNIEALASVKLVGVVLDRRAINRSLQGSEDVVATPGSSERVRLRLQPTGGAIPSGIYKLVTSLDSVFLEPGAPNVRNIMTIEHVVGFRVPDTRADRMNAHIHLAVWAEQRKDYAAARKEIQELLLINPSSAIAFTYLGNFAKQEGNCPEAIRHWQKAVDIFSVAGDADDNMANTSSRESGIQNLRARAAQCR